MRWKIIIVNAGIVLVMTALTYFLLGSELRSVLANPGARRAEAERALRVAGTQLEVDGFALERWLVEQASRPEVRAVFSGGTERARSDSATTQADKLRELLTASADFARTPPGLVLFVDAQGVALGRNGSNLMRGERIADLYPLLAETLRSGRPASDLWLSRERQEQLLASYATVRDDEGRIAGALVVGTPLNDERLARTSDLTSGRPLALAVKGGSGLEILAKSETVTAEALSSVDSSSTAEAAAAALQTGNVAHAAGNPGGFAVAVDAIHERGTAKSGAVLVALSEASMSAGTSGLLWPVLAVGLLGVFLVFVGGMVLGNYIAEPISEIEEGLLQIINGRTDVRFNIEHEDLGGLISRLNSLLNALTGVPETDEEGRTSATGRYS